jgi:predicted phage terminase large subunit-like protein
MWIVTCVDPAISVKEWADYSAIATIGFHHDGMAYVLDLKRGHWPESQLVSEVYDNFERIPGISVVGFEAVGFQKLYFREFQRIAESRGHYLPLSKLERDTKVGKNVRIRGLQPLWDSQTIVFASDLPALPDFLSEAERFRPWKESTHDDMLDALADCLQMRVRPAEIDPLAVLDDETRETLALDREIETERFQAGNKVPLDQGSLRASRLLRRHLRAMEHGREQAALGTAEMGEFYSG